MAHFVSSSIENFNEKNVMITNVNVIENWDEAQMVL